MNRQRLASAIAVAMMLCAWLSPIASAQIRIQFISPEERVAELFDAQDYDGAAAYIEERLASVPDDAAMLYSLACARSRLGDRDVAADLLMRAIKAGFNDFSQMQRDGDLMAVRDHKTFVTLVAALKAADDLVTRRQLELFLESMPGDITRIDRDSLPGIAIVTQDEGIDIATLAPVMRDHIRLVSHTLFGGQGLRQRINVFLPSVDEGSALLNRRHAGGVYRHNQRMLIALDTAVCLRHELVHALHHGEMDRLGQQHPLWIEEGLALLLEDYEADSTGSIQFPQTERDNIARMMLREERLMSWSLLMADDDAVTVDPARSYAQLRSMMRFIHRNFGIGNWYATYVEHFQDDPTGRVSLEAISGSSIAELESQWRQWLSQEPIMVVASRETREKRTSATAQEPPPESARNEEPVMTPASSVCLPPFAW